MIQLRFDKEHIFIKDIFKTFNKRYWTKDIDTTYKKRGASKNPLDIKLYKKIVKTYLLIYFNELYFGKYPEMYFFLGGKMKLARSDSKWSNTLKVLTQTKVSLLWFKRPHASIWKAVKIRKLNGSTNIFCNLDVKFLELYDVSLVPNIKTAMTKIYKEKNTYQ